MIRIVDDWWSKLYPITYKTDNQENTWYIVKLCENYEPTKSRRIWLPYYQYKALIGFVRTIYVLIYYW